MLNKIKNELRVVMMYNLVIFVTSAIMNNNGIDKYLIEEMIDVLGDGWYVFLTWTAAYVTIRYIISVVVRQVKNDVKEVKNNLKKEKVEEA